MPKKKKQETSEEQFARFQKDVREMVAAGELNPIEADEKFEKLVGLVLLPSKKQAPE